MASLERVTSPTRYGLWTCKPFDGHKFLCVLTSVNDECVVRLKILPNAYGSKLLCRILFHQF